MLDRLPNEILYQILAQLSSVPPPSYTQLNTPPSPHIVRASSSSPLKNFARVSSHFAELVRPVLFAHCCCDIARIGDFLSFVARFSLQRRIISIVVIARSDEDTPDDVPEQGGKDASNTPWWRRLFRETNPSQLTLIAPPTVIGQAVATNVMDGHNWAFDITFQTLSLEQDVQEKQQQQELQKQPNDWPTLLHTRRWKTVCFNESSSLKAYNHYEYFRHRVPSILDAWGNPGSTLHMGSRLENPLANITHFRYTAVFPFYNHICTVLRVVQTAMPSLESLSAQLAPDRNNRAIEKEQRGSMDPNDPWMELSTGFSLIARVVRDLGEKGRMKRFQACDYDIEALRSNLSTVICDVLPSSQWEHDGSGTWTKREPIDENQ
ncbi:hypothetical protein PISL3812_03172 [Talaromyces islandicus]|uniref:F-box domain-containing protein n=1 Tax=Talaromyces islandicus TaxID=28573 RepID=A0A0U1LRZ2_TALIS|nr:hypothetical protein PISL3812_03172 [Talaromyces islandicus]